MPILSRSIRSNTFGYLPIYEREIYLLEMSIWLMVPVPRIFACRAGGWNIFANEAKKEEKAPRMKMNETKVVTWKNITKKTSSFLEFLGLRVFREIDNFRLEFQSGKTNRWLITPKTSERNLKNSDVLFFTTSNDRRRKNSLKSKDSVRCLTFVRNILPTEKISFETRKF